MATNQNFVVKNGLTVGTTAVIDSSGAWVGSSSGLVGTQGTSGSQGTSGTQGLTGTQGTSGNNGSQGTTGSQGTEGPQGTTGAQGTTGTQGLTGSQGTTGAQGTTGTQGTTGAQGTTGSQGLTGTQGTTGTSIQGASGTSIQGAAGTSIQGAAGTSIQGASGTSVQGAAGTSIQGATGTSVQGAQGATGSFSSGSNASLNNAFVNSQNSATGTDGQLSLWSTGPTTTSAFGFKAIGGVWGRHGAVTGDYASFFTMDTTNRGWIFRLATVGGTDFTGTNLFSISNNSGVTTVGSSWGTASTYAQLNVSQGKGSATLYRDIDLRGDWAGGEGHAISANHGSSSTNLVGQMVFQHDGPGSRIKWGRLYHSGDQSTYPMELISDSSSAYLTVGGSVRSPIFYDSNDTGYYIDPNSTSSLAWLSSDTMARHGLNVHRSNRRDNTSDTNYFTGSNGWNESHTWDSALNTLGSGFIDLWGYNRTHPQGSGYVHAQGLQVLHYRDGGSASYGWQMVGAADADSRWWLRGKWGTTYRSWYEIALMDKWMGNVLLQAGGAVYGTIFYDANNSGYYVDPNGTTYVYYLQSATTIRADSDARLKDNVITLENSLDKVRNLRGVTYTRKDLEDKTKKHIGLIAQEVLEVVPEVVGGSESAYYSVGYAELVPVLIEAIKEQQQQIEELKALIHGN